MRAARLSRKQEVTMDWLMLIMSVGVGTVGVLVGYAISSSRRTMYNAYVARTKMFKEMAREGIVVIEVKHTNR